MANGTSLMERVDTWSKITLTGSCSCAKDQTQMTLDGTSLSTGVTQRSKWWGPTRTSNKRRLWLGIDIARFCEKKGMLSHESDKILGLGKSHLDHHFRNNHLGG